ncbi:MAG TPA: hypothetical protein VHX63_05435 [Acidobacteriaceae bacterium]|jgi:hypothetical protein|nr:hypothetical protein [Acidobacteriaceae bacterium]
MTIQKITPAGGLVGGGSTPTVQIGIDPAVVPQLQTDNTFAGSQTIEGDLQVSGTVNAAQLAVDSTAPVANLNASMLQGVPVSKLARKDEYNDFELGQSIGGTLSVTANSNDNPYPELGMSAPGIVAFGCFDHTEETIEAIPNAGTGVVGIGGNQINEGLGSGGDGVHGIGGDQIGQGGGGTGVTGFGGGGSDGQWGGIGGIFIGGEAENGDGGAGLSVSGGNAELITREPYAGEFHMAGNGIKARGGWSWSAAAAPGMGGLFFGGDGQYMNGSDGIWGVPGYGPSRKQDGRAGVFEGDVLVMGKLHVSGHKSFRIDHPVRPAEELLIHACVESSELLTIYSGNTALDKNGRGVVTLPDWFEALNTDFRYQLTSIGAAAPLFIEQEIKDGKFVIAGGSQDLKVSWQITAIRHDHHAQAEPLEVEIKKQKHERGFYVHPEAFNEDFKKGLHWATYPAIMKDIADRHAAALARSPSATGSNTSPNRIKRPRTPVHAARSAK